jgi:hypothetical protein
MDFYVYFRSGTQTYKVQFSGRTTYMVSDLITHGGATLGRTIPLQDLRFQGSPISVEQPLVPGGTYELVKNQGIGGAN